MPVVKSVTAAVAGMPKNEASFMFIQGFIMQAKVIISFEQFSEPAFQAVVGRIMAGLTDNPHFPLPWAPPVPSLEQLKAAFAAYQEAYYASQTRDQIKIAQRNELRRVVTRMLRQIGTYLELAADGDQAKLVTTGFELRRDAVRSYGAAAGTNLAAGALEAPREFRIALGGRIGTLELNALGQAKVLSYEVQITQGDPATEAAWQHLTMLPNLRRALLEGLPGGPLWIRVRAFTKDGYGAWTTPLSVLMS
jgi:hypothetical protein